mgnify:CR=1 FL=1
MECIRACPYGHALIGHIRYPCGAQIAIPYGPSVGCIRVCPYKHAHIGPIWVPYGQAYMGTPIKDPCGAQIASPYGPSVGCSSRVMSFVYVILRVFFMKLLSVFEQSSSLHSSVFGRSWRLKNSQLTRMGRYGKSKTSSRRRLFSSTSLVPNSRMLMHTGEEKKPWNIILWCVLVLRELVIYGWLILFVKVILYITPDQYIINGLYWIPKETTLLHVLKCFNFTLSFQRVFSGKHVFLI